MSCGDISDAIQAALRRRARHESNLDTWYFDVAHEVGCSASSVENWLNGGTVPSLAHFKALVAKFGNEFRDEVLGGAAVAEPTDAQLLDRMRADIAEMQRRDKRRRAEC